MSASSDYLRVLTDITREQGATRAATQRANASIWGNSVAKLGEFASDAIKQYGIDKKAKEKEAKDKAWEDLWKRTADEFDAQQQPSAQIGPMTGAPATLSGSIVSQSDGERIGAAIEAEKAAGTYQTPEQRAMLPQGPTLAQARPPRSSPFPTLSEMLKVGGPSRAVPAAEAILALQKVKPGMSNDDKIKTLGLLWRGLNDGLTPAQQAEFYPGLKEIVERNEMLPPGFLPPVWNEQTKAFLQGAGKDEKTQNLMNVTPGSAIFDPASREEVFKNPYQLTPDQAADNARLQAAAAAAEKTREASEARMTEAQKETARHNAAMEKTAQQRVAQAGEAQVAATAPPAEIKPGTPAYRIAQDLASGKMTFSQFRTLAAYNRNAALKFGIYDTARQLNPEFDPAQYELGFKMASNPQIRQRIVAINALNPVIDQVSALVDKVGNTDLPTFNRLLQGAKFHIGDKDVTNFRQMQILLGDEVGMALGIGTGSDLKTRLGLDLVNPNLGPAQFKSTMEQLRAVLDARRSELYKQMGVYSGGVANPAGTSPRDPLGIR